MTLIRVTGSQLHAARVLLGLSREDLAERAGLCRHSRPRFQSLWHAVRISSASQSCGKLLNRLAKGSLLFLHYLDVLPPHGSGRFTQSECLLRQLQIVCRKRHQMFGHARLSTLLGEPYAPFG
jgi:transcriptional regulator with XRE-family HTH domain